MRALPLLMLAEAGCAGGLFTFREDCDSGEDSGVADSGTPDGDSGVDRCSADGFESDPAGGLMDYTWAGRERRSCSVSSAIPRGTGSLYVSGGAERPDGEGWVLGLTMSDAGGCGTADDESVCAFQYYVIAGPEGDCVFYASDDPDEARGAVNLAVTTDDAERVTGSFSGHVVAVSGCAGQEADIVGGRFEAPYP